MYNYNYYNLYYRTERVSFSTIIYLSTVIGFSKKHLSICIQQVIITI